MRFIFLFVGIYFSVFAYFFVVFSAVGLISDVCVLCVYFLYPFLVLVRIHTRTHTHTQPSPVLRVRHAPFGSGAALDGIRCPPCIAGGATGPGLKFTFCICAVLHAA